ncbi:MAG: permease [Anaerolineales bacterium]|nr:permease [Anaerolineales bacterium]
MATSDETKPNTAVSPTPPPDRTLNRVLLGLLAVVALVGALPTLFPDFAFNEFQTFVTIFMGIFLEAVPFLVAGAVVSGLLEVFVDKQRLTRLIPRQPLAAAFVGALLGFAFPVCECGVVPVTRRLYQKGLPLPVGIAFLLAAPVMNPIVLAGTFTAFGWGPILIGRFFLTLLIAFAVGALFSLARPEDVLLPQTHAAHVPTTPFLPAAQPAEPLLGARFWQALAVAADEFLDMARYLIVGAMLAAAMQTLVPRATLLGIGQGPVLSIVVMMLLAFVLSICSTVDSFVALSFVNTFNPGAILAFLVFGPMVDIKSSLMFLGVFRRRVVGYLILLPMLLTFVLLAAYNLFM